MTIHFNVWHVCVFDLRLVSHCVAVDVAQFILPVRRSPDCYPAIIGRDAEDLSSVPSRDSV